MPRTRPSDRRHSANQSLQFMGMGWTYTHSRFADGRIAEVFVNNHKSNSAADVSARDAAIILSFALQHGADLSAIGKALSRDSHGRPSGVMGAVIDLPSGRRTTHKARRDRAANPEGIVRASPCARSAEYLLLASLQRRSRRLRREGRVS
jgi:hypothetical protein